MAFVSGFFRNNYQTGSWLVLSYGKQFISRELAFANQD